VSPPACGAKIKELERQLSDVYALPGARIKVEEADIQGKHDAIILAKPVSGTREKPTAPPTERPGWREEKLDSEYLLAKFALLRWDELNELAYRLAKILKAKRPTSVEIDADLLRQALGKIDDSEWRKNKSYEDYLRDRGSARRDYQMLNVWELKGSAEAVIRGAEEANGIKWLSRAVNSTEEIEQVPGFELLHVSPGTIEIRALNPSRQAKRSAKKGQRNRK
jgi:hypothetical protein